ncbi:MAG: DUF4397 domain-containing protein [Candidatus Eremiobacteraeota bacterium]|nr:DUF4397 domain-containing protein [Candidatus Eremiobacteraeota bacterium]
MPAIGSIRANTRAAFVRRACALAWVAVVAGCGSGSSPSSGMPPTSNNVTVRFADGAPSLETLVNGVPTDIGAAYLQANGKTVTSSFNYGTLTTFMTVAAGTLSLRALDTLGYFVGPLQTPPLTAGNRYTLVVVGAYPNYSVLAFSEPKTASGAALSFYDASPTVPSAGFGSFSASTHSNFKQLGNGRLGSVATVPVGAKVSNFGGYVGNASAPIGTLTPRQINSFDLRNILPFHRAARLSLFLFDPKPGTPIGPVIGSLDR